MKIIDLIAQLQAVLPKYSDDFSTALAVSTLTRSGTTATATCAAAHGLSAAVENYVLIKGAYSPNTIASLTQAAGVATAVTALPHDLTYEEGKTVLISGATQAGYNGAKELLSVVDEHTFTFAVATNTATPATGTPILNEAKAAGYNGRVKVTVTGANTFTYTVPNTIPAAATGTIKAVTGVRITGAVTLERLGQLYTEESTQDKLWMFVLPGNTAGSHNRQIQSDATYRYAPGQAFFQEIIQSAKIVVVVPTANDLSARAAVDKMEDLRPLLFKSILGVQFNNTLSNGQQYGLTYVDDGVVDYNGAYLAYGFNFEQQTQVGLNDICQEDDSVAWRSFTAQMLAENTEKLLKEVAGKLP